MQIDVLTLFPEMFDSVMNASMMYKARHIGALTFSSHDIRDFANNKHLKVDDTPYGGGGGMILQAPPVVAAVEHVTLQSAARPRVLLMTPQGRLLTHALAESLAQEAHLIFICAHYEGIDERVRELVVTDEVSIGDYVLTGGELAAMVVIDAVARFLPGVLGAEGAVHRDSHADGLLEGPHYTRPRAFRGLAVPLVLQEGHHLQIERWRRQESLRRTWLNRPDLLLRAQLSEEDRYFLAVLANEYRTATA